MAAREPDKQLTPRPVIANIYIGRFIFVSVKDYISSSFYCHLVGDLPFVRVAPDPQQPSGLGQRGLCRSAGDSLAASPFMIQRCLDAVSTSQTPAIQWVRRGAHRTKGGRHWQIPLGKPRRRGARRADRKSGRTRWPADRARERDGVAAVGCRSKAESDGTASRPVCDTAGSVFAEEMILHASHENQKGAVGKRGLKCPANGAYETAVRHQTLGPRNRPSRQRSVSSFADVVQAKAEEL